MARNVTFYLSGGQVIGGTVPDTDTRTSQAIIVAIWTSVDSVALQDWMDLTDYQHGNGCAVRIRKASVQAVVIEDPTA